MKMKETPEARAARRKRNVESARERDRLESLRMSCRPTLEATAKEKAAIIRDWGEDEAPPEFLARL